MVIILIVTFVLIVVCVVLEAKDGTISVASAFPGHQEGNVQLFTCLSTVLLLGLMLRTKMKWPVHGCQR